MADGLGGRPERTEDDTRNREGAGAAQEVAAGGTGPTAGTAPEHGPWEGVYAPPFAGRVGKPREVGVTGVIDTGLGAAAAEDLMELAGGCIDFWKLAFGTSAFYSEDALHRKIAAARRHGIHIYPGGTFLEVAVVQGKGADFLARTRDLGFSFAEVSDGTIQMSPRTRYRLIERAQKLGLGVVTEVGKKHPADRVPRTNIREQIAADLAHGAWKVIVEGRESGKGVVIYRDDGSVDEDELEGLVESVTDLGRLIWEAPLKNQQQDLILRFGTNVNLGNIHPSDILSVESLRVGLRGDTLRAAILSATIPAANGGGDEAEDGRRR
jgi:phosphosulfolactate synthase